MVQGNTSVSLSGERVRLWGVVQGVGFRPFITRLANRHGLRGYVRNRGGLVELSLLGGKNRRRRFRDALYDEMPQQAHLIREKWEPLLFSEKRQLSGSAGNRLLVLNKKTCPAAFQILASDQVSGLVFPSPDLPVCPDCLQEMAQPGNRRYQHALISCMSCGPRFSIMSQVPYDRLSTSLAAFPLCPDCRQEYRSIADRRFHAQTVSCLQCGPSLHWQARQPLSVNGNGTGSADPVPDASAAESGHGENLDHSQDYNNQDHSLDRAITAIHEGQVIAVKGIGGYHLVCDACNVSAVANLREIKQRDRKPFAVMFPDLDSIDSYAWLSAAEKEYLTSAARPVVLVRKKTARSSRPLAAGVCDDSAWIGAFLPYTPIQVILLGHCGPLVMTSANLSDQPILYQDQTMVDFMRQQPLLAGVLTHDRPILVGLDDSVMRVVADRPLLIRRSRGLVPLAIDMGEYLPSSVLLAAGGDLKATFALACQGFVWLSPPVGDLEQEAVQQQWHDLQQHYREILALRPDHFVVDSHPGYHSAQSIRSSSIHSNYTIGNPAKIAVLTTCQHHVAHIASVLAEHHLQGPVLGLAFDGTGYGDDQTIWGGELLLVGPGQMVHLGGLKPNDLPGGDTAMRDAWRSLLGYLVASAPELQGAFPKDDPLVFQQAGLNLPLNRLFPDQDRRAVNWLAEAIRQHVGCHANSSMGRLFDAVCVLLGLSDRNHYEGECGSLLESQARQALDEQMEPWPVHLAMQVEPEQQICRLDPAPIWLSLLQGLKQGASIPALALGFHQAIAEGALLLCERGYRQGVSLGNRPDDIRRVACSGGVFQNTVLCGLVQDTLSQAGFTVYWNERVPPNDGGICLGQVYMAMQEMKNEEK